METTFLHGMTLPERHEAVRYMVERARTFWPGCLVRDPQGEEYGRLSKLLPCHVIISPAGKSSRYGTIELQASVVGVRLGWYKLSVDLARHLFDDPVWGPDWLPRSEPRP